LSNPVSTGIASGDYEVGTDYSGMGGCIPDLSDKPTKFPILRSKVTGTRMRFVIAE
jgi:hypothetical protein